MLYIPIVFYSDNIPIEFDHSVENDSNPVFGGSYNEHIFMITEKVCKVIGAIRR
jgi:hypothetical protein